jgi:hypothetical protein
MLPDKRTPKPCLETTAIFTSIVPLPLVSDLEPQRCYVIGTRVRTIYMVNHHVIHAESGVLEGLDSYLLARFHHLYPSV